jgi:hypothetical protein
MRGLVAAKPGHHAGNRPADLLLTRDGYRLARPSPARPSNTGAGPAAGEKGRDALRPSPFTSHQCGKQRAADTARPKARGCTVSPGSPAKAINGYVKAAGEGQAFWFLNTQAQLSVLEHRVPPGFAPPPHVHLDSDEAFFICPSPPRPNPLASPRSLPRTYSRSGPASTPPDAAHGRYSRWR